MTTVRGSGAETCRGLPCTITPEASALLTTGSYSARNENTTSSDVKGTPSEKATPSRRVRVNTRPSGEAVHVSASHGSNSPVRRLRRTRDACVRRGTASTAACSPPGAYRLKVDGSLRSVTVGGPPRPGPPAADFHPARAAMQDPREPNL